MSFETACLISSLLSRESLGETCRYPCSRRVRTVLTCRVHFVSLCPLCRVASHISRLDGYHDVRRNTLRLIRDVRTRKIPRLRSSVAVDQRFFSSLLFTTYPAHSCRSWFPRHAFIIQKRWWALQDDYYPLRIDSSATSRDTERSATGLGMWQCGEGGVMLGFDSSPACWSVSNLA